MPPDHRSARAHQDAFSSQAAQTIKQEVRSFQAFLLKVSNDYSLTLSSALAFTLLLSTFPIALVLLFLLLVPLMLFTASTAALTFSLVQQTPVGHSPFLARAAGPLGGFLASFLFFESIYVVVPNMHIRLRHGAVGAVVAAIAL